MTVSGEAVAGLAAKFAVMRKVANERTWRVYLGSEALAQMAISWVLRDPRVTSALIGASSVEQLEENLAAAAKTTFTPGELAAIDADAVEAGINIWAASSAG